MTKDASMRSRKGLRIGHVSERGAVNAVRTLLEANSMVVDEVDGRSDYGRDLNVDITTESRLTGGIIGIQVKGGKSFFRKGRWVLPASPADWEYWRSSTVPIIGMTWDPETGTIHWVNLTQRARARVLISDGNFEYELQDDKVRDVVADKVLDQSTFRAFIDEIGEYLNATNSSAFLELLDDRDEIRRRGVYTCWTLGRWDPRPLILLRRLLPSMQGLSLIDGITALAHATSHPDIFWTPRNWISEPVKTEVKAVLRWSPGELLSLVHKLDLVDPDVAHWERGGAGQSLWAIIAEDPGNLHSLRSAVKLAVEERKLDAAVRLLICYQWAAEHPSDDLRDLLSEVPELLGHRWVYEIVESVEREGRIDVY